MRHETSLQKARLHIATLNSMLMRCLLDQVFKARSNSNCTLCDQRNEVSFLPCCSPFKSNLTVPPQEICMLTFVSTTHLHLSPECHILLLLAASSSTQCFGTARDVAARVSSTGGKVPARENTVLHHRKTNRAPPPQNPPSKSHTGNTTVSHKISSSTACPASEN